MTKILGAVLAGGRSRRFGSDKALALLDGERLIDRAIAALRPQVDAVIICGRDMPGVQGVADRPEAGLGPLGGLNGALHYAGRHGFAAVVSVPCDTPMLPADLVARFAAIGSAAAVGTMPVIGWWPASLADRLDHHLATIADRSMRSWARIAGAAPVGIGEIANINSAEDLDRLAGRHA